jgi:DNA polymerase I
MRFRSVAPAPIYVNTIKDVEACLERCWTSRLMGVDTETLGLEKDYLKTVDQVVNLGLAPDPEARYFIPRRHLHHFRDLLASSIPKALHNSKWDLHRLANAGVTIGGKIYETLVMDFLFDEDTRENRHGLDACVLDFFDIPMAKYKDIVGDEDPRNIVPGHPKWPKYLDYGSLDPWATLKLAKFHEKNLAEIKMYSRDDFLVELAEGSMTEREVLDFVNKETMLKHYWRYEEPQVKALFNIERRGIRIDTDHLGRVVEALTKEMEECAAKISKIAGRPLNPNSPKQVGEWLFGDLGLTPLKTTKTGNHSTDEDTLQHFAQQGVEGCLEILAYKKASKVRGTYAIGLTKWVDPRTGKIHTNYSPVKVTGRLGSNSPNLQNVPRPDWDTHKIRAAFIPDTEDDVLLVVDYGQLEMRVLASAAENFGDSTMAQGIRDGRDMHSFTGGQMIGIPYEEFLAIKKDESHPRHAEISSVRQAAKAINFGIVYGIGAQGLAKQLTQALGRAVSETEAQSYIDTYFRAFPGVRLYMAAQKRMATSKGRVQTLAGRFRRLSGARSSRRLERSYALRQSINAPIQGSAADIVKKAMIEIEGDEYLREELGCTIRMQVHDEFVLNVKGGRYDPELVAECAEIVQGIMEASFSAELSVPLIAEPAVCLRWSDAKE